MSTALIVLDTQHDFLAASGSCSQLHVDSNTLQDNIVWLISTARQRGIPVLWTLSHYGLCNGTPDELRGLTHIGKPCCTPETQGARLSPRLESEHHALNEPSITKHWFSAFRETTLHTTLQQLRTHTIVLCGVGTNTSILETARDAKALGYTVHVLENACAAASLGKHQRALHTLEHELRTTLLTWNDWFSQHNSILQLNALGAGDSSLVCNALSHVIQPSTFAALEHEVQWHTMKHRGGLVPRLISIQGSRGPHQEEPLYRHPVDAQPPLVPWTPIVDAIRRVVEIHVKHPLNHALVQLYRNGRDWIGEHSDKTLDVMPDSKIVNVSLGATRTMVLKPKLESEEHSRGSLQKIPLVHASLFVMGLQTNRAYYHGVRPQGEGEGAESPRISLTFRWIGTYLDPHHQLVWGVGAPFPTRDSALERQQTRITLDSVEARSQQLARERETLLQLFHAENRDPLFDRSAYQPGFEVIDFPSES